MNKRAFLIIGSIVCVIAILVLTDHIAIPCIFNEITGLYCPGCGITRAILSLLKGDLYQAFRYNSIIFIDIPLILFLGIFEKLFKKNNNVRTIVRCVSNIILIILLIITIMYGVMRNIPSFSYLAPTMIR